ncbi:MAG: inosose dehydratase, partial [Subtercola sp.]|nr:inosose dehydratase [Subtercola sp.]
VPELGPIVDAVAALDSSIFGIVEQDMYGTDIDLPLGIATRTRENIFSCTSHARIH